MRKIRAEKQTVSMNTTSSKGGVPENATLSVRMRMNKPNVTLSFSPLMMNESHAILSVRLTMNELKRSGASPRKLLAVQIEVSGQVEEPRAVLGTRRAVRADCPRRKSGARLAPPRPRRKGPGWEGKIRVSIGPLPQIRLSQATARKKI